MSAVFSHNVLICIVWDFCLFSNWITHYQLISTSLTCFPDTDNIKKSMWNVHVACWLADWLADLLTDLLWTDSDWLANWLGDPLTDWLSVCCSLSFEHGLIRNTSPLVTVSLQVYVLIGWPNAWLTDWLINLTDFLNIWLTRCLTDWLAVWLANSLTGWLSHCLTGWLTDWLTVRSVKGYSTSVFVFVLFSVLLWGGGGWDGRRWFKMSRRHRRAEISQKLCDFMRLANTLSKH